MCCQKRFDRHDRWSSPTRPQFLFSTFLLPFLKNSLLVFYSPQNVPWKRICHAFLSTSLLRLGSRTVSNYKTASNSFTGFLFVFFFFLVFGLSSCPFWVINFFQASFVSENTITEERGFVPANKEIVSRSKLFFPVQRCLQLPTMRFHVAKANVEKHFVIWNCFSITLLCVPHMQLTSRKERVLNPALSWVWSRCPTDCNNLVVVTR